MDGKLTFEKHSNSALPEHVVEAIESASNEMAYVFKGNKTTYTPVNSIESQDNWYTWKLIENSPDSTLIKLPKGKEIRFMKLGNCIGLDIEAYSYIEYYCKVL